MGVESNMSKRGRGGAAGNKFRMTLGLPVGAALNCADNTGAKGMTPPLGRQPNPTLTSITHRSPNRLLCCAAAVCICVYLSIDMR